MSDTQPVDSVNDGDAEANAHKNAAGPSHVSEKTQFSPKTSLTSRLGLRKNKKPLWLKTRSAEWLLQLCVGYGIFVDLCIYGIAAPVIPFRLETLGYRNIESLTGWLVAAYAGGLIISSPPIGYLGEKVKSRQGPLLLSLLFMAGALVMFMLSKTFVLLLISRILQGVSGTGIWTIGLALLADCVPEDRLALAMGNAMIGMSLGAFAGPPIGGALYHNLGFYAPWIFSIAILVPDAILRLLIIEPKDAVSWQEETASEIETKDTAVADANVDGGAIASPARAFLSLSYNLRAITSMFISFGIGIYVGGVLDGALTLKLNNRYGLNSEGAGLVFIANAVPALVFSPLAGYLTDKYGQRLIATVTLVGVCTVLPFICIDSMNLVSFCAVLAFIGAFCSALAPPISMDLAQLTNITPGLGYAHSYSMFNIAFSLGSFVGPIASGQLLQGLGIKNGFFVMIGITEGCFLLCIPLVLRNFPKDPRSI